MIKLILTGHGQISSGIKSAVNLVYGEVEALSIIDFTQDVTPEALAKKIEEEVTEETLILADIAGGTPFKTASMISLEKKGIKVVGGMNLPMVLELLSERDYEDLDGLYKLAIETGRSEIKGFEIKEREINEDFEDGI